MKLTARLALAVFILALAPRLADLGARPFWYDEILTAWRASMPLPALIQSAFMGQHTPVYFLLLAPLAHLPDPQFWLRLPSAILGALNVMLVFLIARRAGGEIAGIAAALILGLSPTEIAFSQEARSYMLMIFCLLVALHGLTGLAQSGERAALPWRKGGVGASWLQFIAGSAAAFCTLGGSLFWFLSVGISAGFMIAKVKNRFGLLRNFLSCFAICAVLCLPLYLIILHDKQGDMMSHVAATTPALIWYDTGSIYLMRVSDFISRHFMAVPTPLALTYGIGVALVAAAIGGVWRLRRDPMLAACLLPAAFTLPVFAGIVAIFKPVLTARYLLWGGSPFAILAGIGVSAALSKLPSRTRYGALAAFALALVVNLLPFYHAETKPRWDIAARIFAEQAKPQDVAYYCDSGGEQTMRYYLPAKLQPSLLTTFAESLPQAVAARAQGKRLWVFYGDAWNRRHWRSLADFQASLAPLGPPNAELHAGSRITIWRYDPDPK